VKALRHYTVVTIKDRKLRTINKFVFTGFWTFEEKTNTSNIVCYYRIILCYNLLYFGYTDIVNSLHYNHEGR